jgi:hypothetical protein
MKTTPPTPPTHPAPVFVTRKAIAARYSVTPRTVQNWIAAGIFPTVKISGTVRIRLADAIQAIEVDSLRNSRLNRTE